MLFSPKNSCRFEEISSRAIPNIFCLLPVPILSRTKILRKSATKVKNQGFSIKSVPNSMIFGQNLFISSHFKDLRNLIHLFLGIFFIPSKSAKSPGFLGPASYYHIGIGKIFWCKKTIKNICFLITLVHISINFLQISDFPQKPSKCMENDGFWCLTA